VLRLLPQRLVAEGQVYESSMKRQSEFDLCSQVVASTRLGVRWLSYAFARLLQQAWHNWLQHLNLGDAEPQARSPACPHIFFQISSRNLRGRGGISPSTSLAYLV
jgi:hypothetical protein